MYKSIFLGLTIGLLAVIAVLSQTMVSNASIENNSSDFNQGGTIMVWPLYAVDHINHAQTALQNGDTENANHHLELAKQHLQGNQTGQ